MSRKKITITILLAMIIVAGLFSTYFYYNKNINAKSDVRCSDLRPVNSNNNSHKVLSTASEIQLSEEQLIDISDIIVRGKITKALGEYDLYVDNNGKTVSIKRINYDFDLSEVLKGKGIDKITISCTGDFLPNGLEFNKEYVLCLTHIDGDYENAYSFVSLSQGNFEVSNDGIKLDKNNIKIDDFKDKINDVKEKNQKGIEIENPLKNIKK